VIEDASGEEHQGGLENCEQHCDEGRDHKAELDDGCAVRAAQELQNSRMPRRVGGRSALEGGEHWWCSSNNLNHWIGGKRLPLAKMHC
jgi:hypothetical protein